MSKKNKYLSILIVSILILLTPAYALDSQVVEDVFSPPVDPSYSMIYGACHYNNIDNIDITVSGDVVRFDEPVQVTDHAGDNDNGYTMSNACGLENVAPHTAQYYNGNIQLRIKDASVGRNTGQRVDALITIDNIYVENLTDRTQTLPIIGWWRVDGKLYLGANWKSTTFVGAFKNSIRVEYRINIKLVEEGTTIPVDGTFLYSMSDIDMPEYTEEYPRDYYGPYAESVTFINGNIGNCYFSQDSTLVRDGNRIHGTAESEVESNAATTVSTLANTQGLTFTWRGSNCGTALDLAYVKGTGRLAIIKQSTY